jgi:hypothetical protein
MTRRQPGRTPLHDLDSVIQGRQAFILKRKSMLTGWLIIYFIAYVFPVLSPDDFSWGNTRVIVGKGADKVTIDKKLTILIPMKRFSSGAVRNIYCSSIERLPVALHAFALRAIVVLKKSCNDTKTTVGVEFATITTILMPLQISTPFVRIFRNAGRFLCQMLWR